MIVGKKDKPYTTGEIASLCHVTINAVKKWIAADKLKAYRTPGGHFRIDKPDFEEFINRYRLNIKDELFPAGKPKVLIADDEPGVVDYISEALSRRDDDEEYDIETAGDGYEALMKVGRFKPDLLILDIRMLRVNGFDLCRYLKDDKNTMNIKILATTAFGKEDMAKALECGADRCMSKPLDVMVVQSEVARLIGAK